MEFLDRELAWLSFNSRVLEQAEDDRIPALERLRFLSIFQSNLDEFFMKRLAPPRAQVIYHQDPKQSARIKSINQIVTDHFARSRKCFKQLSQKQLAKEGIHFLNWSDLKKGEKEKLNEFFRQEVLPVLTPLAVDPGHPFPHISSLSTSLAVKMIHPKNDSPLFARIKIPKVLPGYLQVTKEDSLQQRWLPLWQLIRANLEELFPQMNIMGSLLFRITRNIEFERDEEEAEDLLEMIASELKERKFGHAVKFQCEENPDPWLLHILKEELELQNFDIYEVGEPIDYLEFNAIYKAGPANLKFTKWSPLKNPKFMVETDQLFENIKEEDILLHHPYESFKNTIEKTIVQAAHDPKVIGIKLSLYRTNQDSQLIKALIKAIENGKEVVCVIELKARFDEENNISWAQVLEQAGAHIIYGMVGLKTHCKIALITRKEEHGLQCYAHIGTGNYNADTAAFYTDLGLMTADRELNQDVVNVFHFLTGRSLQTDYNKLLVAPVNLRSKLSKYIEQEIKNHKAGKPAEIIVKINNLEDKKMSKLLYQAADQGVPVKLGVRSICVLKPLPNKDSLQIHSIVDQFLEHSRIFYFRNGSKERSGGRIYMGSADWMTRNLDRRVEVLTPLENIKIKKELIEVLDLFFKDNTQSWVMNKSGDYKRISRQNSKKAVNFQLELKRAFLKKYS